MTLTFSPKAKEKVLGFLEKAQAGSVLRIVATHLEGAKFDFRFELEASGSHKTGDVVVREESFAARLDPTSARYLEKGLVDWAEGENPGFTVKNLQAPAPVQPTAGPDGAAEMTELDGLDGLEGQVLDAIKTIFDPEIPNVNIHDLGLIYQVKADEQSNIKVLMTLTAPNCPAAEQLPADVKTRAKSIPGVGSVDVEITFDPPWTPDRMSEAAKLTLNLL